MSNLYRSAMLNKLPQLPTIAPFADDEDDEGAEAEEDENDSLGALPSSLMPPPRSQRTKQTSSKEPDPAFAPISASAYFDQAIEVALPSRNLSMRVYYTPPTFGAGASQSQSLRDTTVIICHHGAGYTGLSFALFAKEVKERTRGESGVLSVDARLHGKTKALDDNSDSNPEQDLSLDSLMEDAYALLTTTFPDPANAPSFLLVGHSMGGAVLVRLTPRLIAAKHRVTGTAVLDIVEGFTMEALPHMMSLLDSRPDGFGSVEEAVQWHVSNHTIRNALSARISVPAIVKPVNELDGQSVAVGPVTWRTPLRTTAPYWEGWFRGLSSSFLAIRTARLLVLAGTERLDKELMIGQMQGKFQLAVIPETGHMIHEDSPERLAEIIVEFWRRNERVVVGVKKVGEM